MWVCKCFYYLLWLQVHESLQLQQLQQLQRKMFLFFMAIFLGFCKCQLWEHKWRCRWCQLFPSRSFITLCMLSMTLITCIMCVNVISLQGSCWWPSTRMSSCRSMERRLSPPTLGRTWETWTLIYLLWLKRRTSRWLGQIWTRQWDQVFDCDLIRLYSSLEWTFTFCRSRETKYTTCVLSFCSS